MQKIAYQIQGTLFQSPSAQDNLLEVNEVFKNENPLVARKDAFRKFQSYVDVFLDSLGLSYSTDEQAQFDLVLYLKSKTRTRLFNDPALEMDGDFDKGFYLYFIEDFSDAFTTKEGVVSYNNKRLIRCVDGGLSVSKTVIKNNRLVEKTMLNGYQLKQKKEDKELDTIMEQLSKGYKK